MSINFLSIPPKKLSQSITSSASSFKLNNIKSWKRNALGVTTNLAAGDFGTTAYGCFRNDTGTKIEIFEFDPATIASASITITRRGLDFNGDLTTETSNYKLDWSANETTVQLGTDVPQLFQYLKEYIDGASIAGAVNASEAAKGIVEEATDAETAAGTATGGTGAKLFITPAKLATLLAANLIYIKTYIAKPIGFPTSTPTTETAISPNTTQFLGMFNLPNYITVNQISIECTTVTVAGTLDIVIYSENGQTQKISITTASISGTGAVSTTVSPAVTLPPGNYYAAVNGNGTANVNIRQWIQTDLAGTNNHATKPKVSGTQTITASTPATTFTPSSLTFSANIMPIIRLDN